MEQKSPMFWFNVVLLGAGLLLTAIGGFGLARAVETEEAGAFVTPGILFGVGGLCFVVLSITGPVAKWGAVGLLLTFGIVVTMGGAAAWAVGDIGTQTVAAIDADNDGDGRQNEDPIGDSDGSMSDPTEVNGPLEIADPADDDGDGARDEDPPEPGGVRDVTNRIADIGQLTTIVGIGLLVLFGVLAWNQAQRAPKATHRSGGT